MGIVRGELEYLISSLTTRFPGYKKQIADVLDGECQRLRGEHYQEQQEGRRNGSR